MQTVEFPLAEFPEGALVRIGREGSNLLVVRSNGQLYAYRDQCPHAFWPLSEGTLKKNVLECPGHGWEFDIVTGRCLNTPDYCLSSVVVAINGDTAVFQWNDVDQRPGMGAGCGATTRSACS